MRNTLALCLLWLPILGVSLEAREFEVRLLKGNEKSGYWGTDEFQCYVNSLGVIRHVSVRGTKVFRQAAALYTLPYPPDAKKAVRTVQGEGGKGRGLTVEPPEMSTRDERGTRIFEFRHVVANEKVLDGEPLCEIKQKIAIEPLGEIHVTYDIEWLRTLRWRMFSHLLIYDQETFAGRPYLALAGDRVFEGDLNPGPITECRIRHKSFDRLTLRPEIGPVHIVWQTKANCSFHWAKSIQLHFGPAAVPTRGFIYKGSKDRIEYTILLPVSLQ